MAKTELSRVEKGDISRAVKNSYYWLKRTRPKNDEEVAERLDEFFAHIIETDERPTIEKLTLALGITNATFQTWKNGGEGYLRAEMLRRAVQMVASMDAELVQDNKIPPIVYIFRAKNFYGMKDVVEHTEAKQEETQSEAELIQRAMELPNDML